MPLTTLTLSSPVTVTVTVRLRHGPNETIPRMQAVLHISVMQSFFFGKGHEPARCEKLRKETTRLRSQILQYDSNASFDHAGDSGGGHGFGGKRVGGAEKTTIAKKIGDYCIACELARLFQDMFSTEGESRVGRRCTNGVGHVGAVLVSGEVDYLGLTH